VVIDALNAVEVEVEARWTASRVGDSSEEAETELDKPPPLPLEPYIEVVVEVMAEVVIRAVIRAGIR
jgi:hypothetical protein